MVLCNLHIIGKEGLHHIHIYGEKIVSVFGEESKIPGDERIVDCGGALAFPGLVNSHDHLDFNLFPQLGNRIYNNYTEWGNDIHSNNNEEIRRILEIPLSLRVQWGIYKNLLNGVTTVVNHGEKLKIDIDLITVFQDCDSLHSASFEKFWKWKLNQFFRKKIPVAMHMGEGTDEYALEEIDKIIHWNFFDRNIIAIHGVQMTARQAEHFKALVWCPASNYFLLNQTALVDQLKKATTVLLGTDSTLTAPWNIWDHIRLARKTNRITDEELFYSLTKNPSRIFGLNAGELSANHQADLVVSSERHGGGQFDSFFSINPQDLLLVMHKGKIKLADAQFCEPFLSAESELDGFYEIQVNKCKKYVWDNLPELTREIRKYYGDVFLPV